MPLKRAQLHNCTKISGRIEDRQLVLQPWDFGRLDGSKSSLTRARMPPVVATGVYELDKAAGKINAGAIVWFGNTNHNIVNASSRRPVSDRRGGHPRRDCRCDRARAVVRRSRGRGRQAPRPPEGGAVRSGGRRGVSGVLERYRDEVQSRTDG